jgi:hypothetical protein
LVCHRLGENDRQSGKHAGNLCQTAKPRDNASQQLN